MRTYKITYLSGASETIEAVGYIDVGDQWIDFVDGQKTQLLRVQAKRVERIEYVKP